MDENKNFDNEELVEVKPEEVIVEETETSEGTNSAAGLAIGALIIGGAVTAATLFIRKHRESWAKKYLEKKGYNVTLDGDAENEDSDEGDESEVDSDEE
jgi:hypothetical protein